MSGDLDVRLRGSRRGQVLEEFFTSSAHFPLVNIFLELLLKAPADYLLEPDPYALLAGAFVQALFLGSRQYAGRPQPFLGNLIGPALYTGVEFLFEGDGFFAASHHLAYWGFALAVGLTQQLQLAGDTRLRNAFILLESVVRSSIVLAMYIILEVAQDGYGSAAEFLSDSPHLFISVVVPLLGVILGFARVTSAAYLRVLRETAGQLRRYSEWLLGPELLSRAVSDPRVLTLARHDRTVLFTDVRGFTRWSESRAPEQVVEMINTFYEAAEPVWVREAALKVKLTADEIMLVFQTPEQAVRAAVGLRSAMTPVLAPLGLGAGTGIHAGPVVEGLMGARERRAYDLLGDTVNTAKRLCDAARGGQILVSDAVRRCIAAGWATGTPLELRVKGKREALIVHPLRTEVSAATRITA